MRMQDSVLINALFRMTEETTFGAGIFAEISIYISLSIAMLSTFGLLYTVYELPGYDKLLSVFLLGLPGVLLVGVGIFGSLIVSPFMSAENQGLLERLELFPLFASDRLFYETAALCGVFFAVCALYIVFVRRRFSERRMPKARFVALACACGFEIVAAAAQLIREYDRPLFVDGDTRVTPHFLI